MYSHISSQATSLIVQNVTSWYFFKGSNKRSGFEVLVTRCDE